MKKVMFALCFMFGGIVVVTAQETQDTTSNQYRTETQSQSSQEDDQAQNQSQNQNQDRERIQSTELPDGVKRSLEGPEYRGWLVSGAFKASSSSEQSTTGESSMESDTTGMNSERTMRDANRQGNTTQRNTEGNANAAGTEGEEMYIVELKNGAETKTLYFNKDGEKIEGMEDQTTPGNQYNQNDQMNNRNETTPGQTSPDQSTSDERRLDNDTEKSQTEQTEETSNQIDHTNATDPKKDDQK